MSRYVAVAKVAEIGPGEALAVRVASREVLVCNASGRFFAVENRCSHAEEKLECGRIRNGWISCPAHGARFDLETGQPLSPPARDPIATYRCRVEGESIEVAV